MPNFDVVTTKKQVQENKRQTKLAERTQTSDLMSRNGKGGAFSSSNNIAAIVNHEIQIQQHNSVILASENLSAKIANKVDLIEKVHELMVEFKDEIMRMRSSTQMPNNNFNEKLDNILTQLESHINGVPSMSGTSELYNTETVDFSNLINAPSSSTPDYDYCLGGDTGTKVHIDQTKTKWDISAFTARDPMFEEFIRAIRIAKIGIVANKDDAYFKDAMDLVDSAEKRADISLQSVSFLKQTIDSKISEMTNQKMRLQEFYESIAVKDVPELIIQHSTVESELESLYHIFTRDLKSIQSLMSLTDRLL